MDIQQWSLTDLVTAQKFLQHSLGVPTLTKYAPEPEDFEAEWQAEDTACPGCQEAEDASPYTNPYDVPDPTEVCFSMNGVGKNDAECQCQLTVNDQEMDAIDFDPSDFDVDKTAKITKRVVRREMRRWLTKGESEGHEFRGNRYTGGISGDQLRSLKNYTGFGYGNINGVLRNGDSYLIHEDSMYPESEKGLLDIAHQDIGNIDAAMRPLEEPTVIYRGMGPQLFDTKENNDRFAANPNFDWNSVVGQSFIDHGFVSTSVELSTAKTWDFKGAVAEIHAPVGVSHVRIPNENASNPQLSEDEILLNRGLVYTVRSVSMETTSLGTRPHLIIDVKNP